MSKPSFSISDSLSESWKIFSSNLTIFVIALVLNIILGIPGNIQNYLQTSSLGKTEVYSNPVLGLIAFVFSIISIFVSFGYLYILIKLVDGKKAELKDFWYAKSTIFSAIGASILVFIVIFIGFLLLIIPGIYLSLRLGLYIYFIIDKDMGPISAIKASWEATKGNVGKLFVFNLALIGVNILGLIALGVGLLVTVPLSSLAMVYVYRKLEKGVDLPLDENTPMEPVANA